MHFEKYTLENNFKYLVVFRNAMKSGDENWWRLVTDGGRDNRQWQKPKTNSDGEDWLTMVMVVVGD